MRSIPSLRKILAVMAGGFLSACVNVAAELTLKKHEVKACENAGIMMELCTQRPGEDNYIVPAEMESQIREFFRNTVHGIRPVNIQVWAQFVNPDVVKAAIEKKAAPIGFGIETVQLPGIYSSNSMEMTQNRKTGKGFALTDDPTNRGTAIQQALDLLTQMMEHATRTKQIPIGFFGKEDIGQSAFGNKVPPTQRRGLQRLRNFFTRAERRLGIAPPRPAGGEIYLQLPNSSINFNNLYELFFHVLSDEQNKAKNPLLLALPANERIEENSIGGSKSDQPLQYFPKDSKRHALMKQLATTMRALLKQDNELVEILLRLKEQQSFLERFLGPKAAKGAFRTFIVKFEKKVGPVVKRVSMLMMLAATASFIPEVARKVLEVLAPLAVDGGTAVVGTGVATPALRAYYSKDHPLHFVSLYLPLDKASPLIARIGSGLKRPLTFLAATSLEHEVRVWLDAVLTSPVSLLGYGLAIYTFLLKIISATYSFLFPDPVSVMGSGAALGRKELAMKGEKKELEVVKKELGNFEGMYKVGGETKLLVLKEFMVKGCRIPKGASGVVSRTPAAFPKSIPHDKAATLLTLMPREKYTIIFKDDGPLDIGVDLSEQQVSNLMTSKMIIANKRDVAKTIYTD